MKTIRSTEYQTKRQTIDRKTLDWIISNEPKELVNVSPYQMKSDEIELIKKHVPERGWFCDEDRAESIHGLRHLLRVSAYSLSLSQKENKRNILISSVLHDIRRLNDERDHGHGERSANWFMENIPIIEERFKVTLNDEDKEEIYNTILYHEISYEQMNEGVYKKHKESIDILKTSDAIDRYRQPKIKWWPAQRYLKLIPQESIKRMAYDLVISSETFYLQGLSGKESVFKSLKHDR